MKYILILFIILLTGCNESKKLEEKGLTKVKLLLNWMPEAEHGGYYEALLKGFYKEEGLDVEIIPGGPGIRVESETAIQRVQFGVASGDKLLIVSDKEMKLQALLSPFENNPRCLVFHKEANISSFDEMNKAQVLILNNTNPYFKWLITKFPKLQKIDTIPYNKATFMSNKAAVIQGFTNSEPLLFAEKGLEVDYIKVSETGYNPYASVLFCSVEFENKNHELVKKMVNASRKGWLSYLQNSVITNNYILSINPSNENTLEKSTAKLKELMSRQDENFGKMTRTRWEELANQLKEINLLENLPVDYTHFVWEN